MLYRFFLVFRILDIIIVQAEIRISLKLCFGLIGRFYDIFILWRFRRE